MIKAIAIVQAIGLIAVLLVLMFQGCSGIETRFEATVIDIDTHWRDVNSATDVWNIVSTVRFDGGRIVDFRTLSLLNWKNDHQIEFAPGLRYRVTMTTSGELHKLKKLELIDKESNGTKERYNESTTKFRGANANMDQLDRTANADGRGPVKYTPVSDHDICHIDIYIYRSCA